MLNANLHYSFAEISLYFRTNDVLSTSGPISCVLSDTARSYNPGQKSLAHVGKNHTFISLYLKQRTYTPSLFSKHDVQTPLPPTQCCGRDLAFAQIMCNIEWGRGESISLKPGGIQSLCLHI